MEKGKKFFGNPLWQTLHIFSVQTNNNNGKWFATLLECYVHLLPCESCGRNLAFKLKHYPPEPYLTTTNTALGGDAFFYTFLLHDLVNEHVNKTLKNGEPPKISPKYDDARKLYISKGKSNFTHYCHFIWQTLHIFGATLRPENAMWFKKLLECYAHLLPTSYQFVDILQQYPPDAYLSNNHDAFFYTYLLHDVINTKITNTVPPKESPNFDSIKTYYFEALSQECKECKV